MTADRTALDRLSPEPLFPSPRPEVESLHAYSAPLEGRRQMLRLDFNENTIGPSPKVVEALRAIPADHIAIYPEYDGLKEAVVANLGLPLQPDQVGLFNGVDAAIHAIFHAYGDRGETLLTTAPTFGYYTPCAQMQGMAIEAIPRGRGVRLPTGADPQRSARRPPAAPDLQSQQPHRHPPGSRADPGVGGCRPADPGGGG